MIDRLTVERVISSSRIEAVVGDYVKLQKRGANLIGCCPFHTEKTPSFSVSPARNMFKCFGCGKGGNVVSFIMEIEKVQFPEAIRMLARRVGIDIEEREETPEEREQRTEREALMAALAWAQSYFHKQLTSSPEGQQVGLAYLHERGLTPETISKFYLGYSPESPDALTLAGQKAGYKLEHLVKVGLTIAKEQRIYDRFRGRVIFPIFSVSGRAIGFGGRALRMGERTAKYLNSPESEVYHKSDTLFGLAQSKGEIAKRDGVILVEGYLDVLSLYQRGVQNVVASSGTALTVQQVRLVSRFTKNITILYDGDSAGIHAAERGADILLAEGMNVKIALLPDGQDPDDFAKAHSLEEILDFVETEKTDFIRFKTSRLLAQRDNDPAKVAQLTQELLRSIALVPDAILRAVYIRDTAKVMGIDEGILTEQLNAMRLKRSLNPQRPDYTKPKEESAQPALEEEWKAAEQKLRDSRSLYENELEIIRILLLFGHKPMHLEENEEGKIITTAADYILAELDRDSIVFQSEVLDRIRQEYILEARMLPDPVAYFAAHADPRIVEVVADVTMEKFTLSRRWERNVLKEQAARENLQLLTEQTVLVYKARLLELMVQEAMEDAQHLEGEDLMNKLMKIRDLNEIRREFAIVLQRIIP